MSTLQQTLRKMIGKPASWDAKEKSLWALVSSRSLDVIYDVGDDYVKIRCQADPVRYIYIPFSAIHAIYLSK